MRNAPRTRLSDAIAAFLEGLRGEAEEHIEQLGGFCGPIRPLQRAWSHMIDVLEHERQEIGV